LTKRTVSEASKRKFYEHQKMFKRKTLW
jgi:hypothetical protein